MLECPILASKNLSNPSKLFLRLYLRLNHPESIPYQDYHNPLTKEEITFESLVPRIVYNSQDELTENIKDFCERFNLKINQDDKSKENTNEKYKSIDDVNLSEEFSVEDIATFQFINLSMLMLHISRLKW